MKKYLIFDLDGTLINTNGKIKSAVVGTIQKHTPEYFKKADELFLLYGNQPLGVYLHIVYNKVELENMISKKIIEEFEKINQNIEFFPGVLEKMVELSKGYKLFLTTSSPTYVAENALKSGGIFELFEIIYGSEQVPKSEEHLEYFKDYSLDEDFYKKAVYIGDGNNDREFAKAKGIDFIHIGNEKKDRYEIESVIHIENILLTLTNKIGE